MSEPTEQQPVVLDAPAADGLTSDHSDVPAGQIEHPDVPTPADAIEHDQPEATPAVAEADDHPEVTPGYPSMLLPPGAYFEIDE